MPFSYEHFARKAERMFEGIEALPIQFQPVWPIDTFRWKSLGRSTGEQFVDDRVELVQTFTGTLVEHKCQTHSDSSRKQAARCDVAKRY